MATIESLNESELECRYDAETGIAYIIYKDHLTPEVTSAAYDWIGNSITVALENDIKIRGCLFDFTTVEKFAPANLTKARQESRTLRTEHQIIISQIPTIVVVQNTYQEMMVRTAMKLAKHDEEQPNARVRMAFSQEEARQFIEDWHARNQPKP
jgi:hypothetical protein